MSPPTLPSLASLAASGHPFAVPWGQKELALLQSFQSLRIPDKEGPWLLESPFDLSRDKIKAIVQHDDDGGSMTYHDALSSRAVSSTEHLSASLAVTVSIPFASASVSGSYDKLVLETENGVQASRNTSCRLGRILIVDTPPLKGDAIAILQDCRIDGKARFQELYGDYYVGGYVLGADAGACLAVKVGEKSETERTEIKVKVKVLWAEKSASHVDVNTKSMAQADMRFFGYNTFTNDSPSFAISTTVPSSLAALQSYLQTYMDDIQTLESTARARLAKLDLRHGKKLPLSVCSDICSSGLVVQLLLFPYARLRDFVQAVPRREYVEHMRSIHPEWQDQENITKAQRPETATDKKLREHEQRRRQLAAEEEQDP